MNSYDFDKLRVLVVDDSSYMIKIVTTLLEAMGIKQVRGIGAEVDVVESIKNWTPHLIIIDQVMEPVTGLQIIRQIRHRDHYQRFIPIILLTGSAHVDVVKDARFRAGADAVLVKPVSAKRLHDCIVAVRDSPRTFIRTVQYFGPDRRVKDRPFEGENRRGPTKRGKSRNVLADHLGVGADRKPAKAAAERAATAPAAAPKRQDQPAAAKAAAQPARPRSVPLDDVDAFDIDVAVGEENVNSTDAFLQRMLGKTS